MFAVKVLEDNVDTIVCTLHTTSSRIKEAEIRDKVDEES